MFLGKSEGRLAFGRALPYGDILIQLALKGLLSSVKRSISEAGKDVVCCKMQGSCSTSLHSGQNPCIPMPCFANQIGFSPHVLICAHGTTLRASARRQECDGIESERLAQEARLAEVIQ